MTEGERIERRAGAILKLGEIAREAERLGAELSGEGELVWGDVIHRVRGLRGEVELLEAMLAFLLDTTTPEPADDNETTIDEGLA